MARRLRGREPQSGSVFPLGGWARAIWDGTQRMVRVSAWQHRTNGRRQSSRPNCERSRSRSGGGSGIHRCTGSRVLVGVPTARCVEHGRSRRPAGERLRAVAAPYVWEKFRIVEPGGARPGGGGPRIRPPERLADARGHRRRSRVEEVGDGISTLLMISVPGRAHSAPDVRWGCRMAAGAFDLNMERSSSTGHS